MVDDELRALKALRLDWAPTPDDVWKPSPFHVDGVHPEVSDTILDGLREAAEGQDTHPLGVVITGPAGAGKTHLLGWLRERVQREGGYFFLVELQDERTFWKSVASSMVEGLVRPAADGTRQLDGFLRGLLELTWAQPTLKDAVLGRAPLSLDQVEQLIGALRRINPVVGMECKDTLRALVLLAGSDPAAVDLGQYYLAGVDEADPVERKRWRFPQEPKKVQQIVRELLRLLALTGPSAVAVDQLDGLVTRSGRATGGTTESDAQLQRVAVGLMDLREIARRALTVIACLSPSWDAILRYTMRSASDRFRPEVKLLTIPSADVARAIVGKRFAPPFQQIGFVPPYPTWPVSAKAFEDAADFTPRLLLQRIDRHIGDCLRAGRVTVLEQLTDDAPLLPPRPAPAVDLTALDGRFAELKQAADAARATDPATEDAAMPELLAAGLAAWIAERGDAGRVFRQDPPPGPRPPLHARLRRTLDAATEDEAHWAFRAIAGTHGNNALPRLRAAMTAAGSGTGRTLIVLRNPPWSSAPRTQQTLAEFRAAGGMDKPIQTDDLTTFAALRDLFTERDPDLPARLESRMPANKSEIFSTVLADATAGLNDSPPAAARPATAPAASGKRDAAAPDEPVQLPLPAPDPAGQPTITLGIRLDNSEPLTVGLRTLGRHAAIFAGAGSGKTVLLRRIVEDCALQGVSAIVLDPNNDLALLGDEWPRPPDGWDAGDAARARDYLANTDVVIWTPGLLAGRPLSFQPLPDFDSVRSNPDELMAAINAAVATLLPKAGIRGAKAQHGEAVLRAGLGRYADAGGRGLRGFVDLLTDLPDGVSRLSDARKIAAGLADALYAATVNDPLFAGSGQAADPGVLLTPAAGKRARVSVISFVGLGEEEQRQSFVNQLEMALFAWIKDHPAGDRPLAGLFVMDEAQTLAPSGTPTAATGSTLMLASQARKYGLGLIFATQAPKGLHNQIAGNATTQMFGLLNSPTQIEAARDMARTKSSDVSDIGRLSPGQFYAAGEGMRFRKVRTRMCLSYHGGPLTREEVVRRAAGWG